MLEDSSFYLVMDMRIRGLRGCASCRRGKHELALVEGLRVLSICALFLGRSLPIDVLRSGFPKAADRGRAGGAQKRADDSGGGQRAEIFAHGPVHPSEHRSPIPEESADPRPQ